MRGCCSNSYLGVDLSPHKNIPARDRRSFAFFSLHCPRIYCSPWHSNINYPSRCVQSLLPPEPCSLRYFCIAGHGGGFRRDLRNVSAAQQIVATSIQYIRLTSDGSSLTTRHCCISTPLSATNGCLPKVESGSKYLVSLQSTQVYLRQWANSLTS